MSSQEVLSRILVVTSGDYEQMENDHDRLPYYAPEGGGLWFMYKKMNHSAAAGDMIRDSVTCRFHTWSEAGIGFIGVDPFCNYFAGLRVNAESDARATGPKASRLRLALIRALSPLSVLRDVFFVPCLVAAAVLKVPGRVDACIGVGPWGGLTALLLRWLGRATVTVYRDRDFETGLVPDRLRQWYTSWAERCGVRRADLVISSGYRLARLRREQSGREVHVVPNGVDWERYAAARNVESEVPALFYVGNIVPWSGVALAIEAMPRICERHPAARLLLVGGAQPGYRRELENLARRLGVAERVEFLGPRPASEVPALMARARIGLAQSQPVPFRTYAYPMKVTEYMAAGLPVIGTAGMETQAIIERHDCGLVVSYDVEALVEAAVRLLEDGDLYTRCRRNGIRGSSEMTWAALVGEEMDLIRHCYSQVSGGTAPGTSAGNAS